MPSPTLSTWPTSETCASAPKFWISRFRIAEISAGWISILHIPFLLALHGRADAVQFGTNGAVEHARAQLDHQAAQQCRIYLGFQARFAAESGFEDAFQFRSFAVGEWAGGGDLGQHFALQLGE